jgi:hypothetical protein
MKARLQLILIVALCIVVSSVRAQSRKFKDGNVWEISFIKTKPNMSVEYLNSLKANWKAVNDEAMKQGLIISYKILDGQASNPGDWDIMLMVEYKNLASMEGNDEKWDNLEKTVLGNEDSMKNLNQSRTSIREIFGSKVLREVVYQ